MIKSKLDLKEYLSYELKNKGLKGAIKRFFSIGEAGILDKHQVYLRKTEYYKNTNKKLRYIINKLKLSSIQNKYSIHIPLNCFGKGLKIMHIGPILVNGKVKAGENIVLHMNSAIVAGGGKRIYQL